MKPSVAIPFALALILLAGAVAVTEADPTQNGARSFDASRIDRLIEQLGADDYDVRARAQSQLESLPPVALPHIALRYRSTDDPEVRMRLHLYAMHHYEKHVRPKVDRLQRPAFLGVAQALTVGPDGEPVIEVRTVLDGTAADAAGFEVGDQILSLDGKPVDPPDVNVFSRTIKDHAPGTSVIFTVRRHGRIIKLPATLGPLPDEHMSAEVHNRLREQIRRHRRQWWNEHFLADTGPAEASQD